jgi:hypothetical protein
MAEIRKPKFEIRNNPKIRIEKIFTDCINERFSDTSRFRLRICFEFRISNFEFQSKDGSSINQMCMRETTSYVRLASNGFST